MSSRLNRDREKSLQPKRIQYALDKLKGLNKEVIDVTETCISFRHDGSTISYFPYSGWHTGRGIKDGRGWNHLYNQIKQNENHDTIK